MPHPPRNASGCTQSPQYQRLFALGSHLHSGQRMRRGSSSSSTASSTAVLDVRRTSPFWKSESATRSTNSFRIRRFILTFQLIGFRLLVSYKESYQLRFINTTNGSWQIVQVRTAELASLGTRSYQFWRSRYYELSKGLMNSADLKHLPTAVGRICFDTVSAVGGSIQFNLILRIGFLGWI